MNLSSAPPPPLPVALLHAMKRIRAVEEGIAERYSEGEMRCPTHLCSGQEAVSAAVGLALRPTDLAVSGHRAHGHYLGKGGNLPRMLAEIYGKATGCAQGKGGSMHLIDQEVGFMGSTAIVGGTIPLGVGLALASRQRGLNQVSGVFLGDGATEEGVFYESLSFAALRQLPVLFVCENNRYSVYTPLSKRQPAGRDIAAMVAGIGVPATHGDGNDALAVYQQTTTALQEIRAGGGPRFLLFDTHRLREHCGPNHDDDLGYRPAEELASWATKDPIAQLAARLIAEGIVEEKTLQTMDEEIAREVEAAFLFAKASPFPAKETAYTNLYRE